MCCTARVKLEGRIDQSSVLVTKVVEQPSIMKPKKERVARVPALGMSPAYADAKSGK